MERKENTFGLSGRVSVVRRRIFGVLGTLLFLLVGVVVPSGPSGAQSSLLVHSRALGSLQNGWQTTTWGNSSAALLVDVTNWGGFQVKHTGFVTFPSFA